MIFQHGQNHHHGYRQWNMLYRNQIDMKHMFQHWITAFEFVSSKIKLWGNKWDWFSFKRLHRRNCLVIFVLSEVWLLLFEGFYVKHLICYSYCLCWTSVWRQIYQWCFTFSWKVSVYGRKTIISFEILFDLFSRQINIEIVKKLSMHCIK